MFYAELEQNVAKSEKAARKLCEIRGIDPESLVIYNDGSGHAVRCRRRAWQSAEVEIIKHLQVLEALRSVE